MSNDPGSLVLGWRIDKDGHPAYWMQPEARAGNQSINDLVCIPAKQAARHTAIIAQSGSGKSFFLGRLVEELLLNTRCRMVIFDPNADFRKSDSIQASMWNNTGYDPSTYLGKMPTEADFESVATSWQSIPKKMFRGDINKPTVNYEPMRVWWPILATDLIAEDLSPAEAVELRHCHAFVQTLAVILKDRLTSTEQETASNQLLDWSQEAFFQLLAARQPSSTPADLRVLLASTLGLEDSGLEFDRAVRSFQHVSAEVAKYYFARAHECENAGILRQTPPPDWQEFRQIVIDLPSLPNAHLRQLVVYQVLSRLWTTQLEAWREAMSMPAQDDRRVPYFIVVDEAHNLIPAEPQNRAAVALREFFRTVVAEGRKFGLFLIVVSQRPDKLDPMILSACENKIVMRMDSADVLQKIENVMDVPPEVAAQLSDCLKFRIGRGLLFGAWATDGPVKFLSAARRTVEGGRNLNAGWWAQPPE
jgi:type II secretory pathway predicted ATPase ExeA